MPAVDQTPTFKLNLPTFDLRVWHTYVNENFSVIDSVLQHYLDIENLVGVWRNATEYHVGERAVDAQNGAIYECLLDNISAAVPTTFAEERVANSAYWGGFTVQEDFKGTWTNSTAYSVQDFVVSGNIYAVCLTSHTSVAAPGVFGDDAVYWIYLINLAGNVLPSITGHGGAYVRARPDETAVEYRTPTQVKADLGISNVVTSWNTRIGDVNLTPADITNAGGASSAGGTLTGQLIIAPTTTGAVLSLSAAPGYQAAINFFGATGQPKQLIFWNGPGVRWTLNCGANPESSGNAGSDLIIQRYNDAGVMIDTPLAITRATGQMTLTATPVAPAYAINNAAGFNRQIIGYTNLLGRWSLRLGNNTAEGGANAGSDFSIDRFSDAGTIIDSPVTINRANGQTTFNSNAAIISAAAGVGRGFYGFTGTTARWQVQVGGSAAESGSNVGSDFGISRYTDAGTPIDAPLSITRWSGLVKITQNAASAGGLSIDGAVTTARVLTATTSGVARWAMHIADSTAEGGANAGSNFSLNAFNDAGTVLGVAFSIARATRVVTFTQTIVNSDRRLKTDIEPIEDALETISALQGVTYHRKAEPERLHIGLIAQDVQEVLPEVVFESAEMSEDGDALLGVDYAKIVSVLIEAVKELRERVNILEART